MRLGLILLLAAVVVVAEDDKRRALERDLARVKARFERVLTPPPGWKVELRVEPKGTVPSIPGHGPINSVSRERLAARQRLLSKLRLPLDRVHAADGSGPDVWYDPGDRTIHVTESFVGSASNRLRDAVLLHELVHAYRDVSGDLAWIPADPLGREPDRSLAERCAVEGDAQLFAFLMTPPSGAADHELLPDGLRDHRAVAEKLTPRIEAWVADKSRPNQYGVAPYREGLLFSLAIFRESGLAGLKAVLCTPPSSMEQVLHPRKYLAKIQETPTQFAEPELPQPISKGWKLIDSGIIGEYTIQHCFRTGLTEQRSVQAAAGWDGSFFTLHAPDDAGSCLLAVITSWDTESDAVEFAAAWSDWAASRNAPPTNPENGGQTPRLATTDGEVVIARRGRRVVVIDGLRGVDPGPLLHVYWATASIAGTPAK